MTFKWAELKYRAWVKREAKAVGSDGCTFVSELYHICCLEHDLGYRYGLDPRSAYMVGWEKARPIARAEVDRRFRECIRAHSAFGRYSPIAFVRWLGVRVFGYFLWNH